MQSKTISTALENTEKRAKLLCWEFCFPWFSSVCTWEKSVRKVTHMGATLNSLSTEKNVCVCCACLYFLPIRKGKWKESRRQKTWAEKSYLCSWSHEALLSRQCGGKIRAALLVWNLRNTMAPCGKEERCREKISFMWHLAAWGIQWDRGGIRTRAQTMSARWDACPGSDELHHKGKLPGMEKLLIRISSCQTCHSGDNKSLYATAKHFMLEGF